MYVQTQDHSILYFLSPSSINEKHYATETAPWGCKCSTLITTDKKNLQID